MKTVLPFALLLVLTFALPPHNDLHRASTYSIFPQIQKEIAAMKLPQSFFTPSPHKSVKKTLRKTIPVKAAPAKMVKAAPSRLIPQSVPYPKVTHTKKSPAKKMDTAALKNKFNLIAQFRFKETSSPAKKVVPTKQSLRLAKRMKAEAELKTLRSRRLLKKGQLLKHFKKNYANEVKYGRVTVHVQLPTNNVDTMIEQMDHEKENTCVFKESFVVDIIKTECNTIWAKPAYLLLTPQEFKLCEKAEEAACYSTVKLCEVSHVFTPTDWQSSPCFKVMSKEKDEHGQNKTLAQICATDYPAAMGWQHAILSYHRCKEAQYKH